mmetsp:Transcript_2937/g.4619  ORF Transcript_2937/g.4619 Transcript_2937/m.4619 type:complete len:235 (-) Transcript_2937:348-1052(-)
MSDLRRRFVRSVVCVALSVILRNACDIATTPIRSDVPFCKSIRLRAGCATVFAIPSRSRNITALTLYVDFPLHLRIRLLPHHRIVQRMPMRIPILHQHPSMLARILHAHPPPRILLQQPHHQIPRLFAHAAPPILVEHHPRTGHRIEARAHIERRRATEQYEQHHADRPTIDLLPVPPIPLHGMPPPQHLRCKVLRSPAEGLQPLRRHILRQSEIRQLDVHVAPPIDHQYVLWF